MTERLTYTKQNLRPTVVINDFDWFMTNRQDVEEWIGRHLPRGLESLKGTVVEFDTDRDATAFILRWGR